MSKHLGRIVLSALLTIYGLFAIVAPSNSQWQHIALSVAGDLLHVSMLTIGIGFLAVSAASWWLLYRNNVHVSVVISVFMSAWMLDCFCTLQPIASVTWFPYVLLAWFVTSADRRRSGNSLTE